MIDPSSALAMPPPTSPTGFGVCVRNGQFNDPALFNIKYAKIATNVQTTTTDKLAASPVKKESVIWRRRPICRLAIGPRGRAARDGPAHQPGKNIHDDSDNNQRQA